MIECRCTVQASNGLWLSRARTLTDNPEFAYVYPSLAVARAAGRAAGLKGYSIVAWGPRMEAPMAGETLEEC